MTIFQYRGGRYIERVTVNVNDLKRFPTLEAYRIDLDGESLSMDADAAAALAVALIEALYGRNELPMDVAETLVNRGNAVLVDAEPIKCPSCNGYGQVGAPWDPETCGSCRGEGTVMARDLMTRDEYEALMADTQTEEE